MFIEVTRVDGFKIVMNSDYIVSIYADSNGCAIMREYNSDTHETVVKESLEEIRKVLDVKFIPRV